MGIIDNIQKRLGGAREGSSMFARKNLDAGGLAEIKTFVFRYKNRER